MSRLSQPRNVDKSQLDLAYKLLRIHAERRREVRFHDGYWTKLFYDSGVPVADIAAHYDTGDRTIYDIIGRQPVNCHAEGQDCTTCGSVA